MLNSKLIRAELYFIAETGPRGLFCEYDLNEPLAVEAFQNLPPDADREPSPTGFPTPFELGVELLRTNVALRFRCKFLREEIAPGFNPLAQVSRFEGMHLILVLFFPDRMRSEAIHLPRLWAMSQRLKHRLFRNRPANLSQETFDRDNWTTFGAILEADLATYLTGPITQAASGKRIAIDAFISAVR